MPPGHFQISIIAIVVVIVSIVGWSVISVWPVIGMAVIAAPSWTIRAIAVTVVSGSLNGGVCFESGFRSVDSRGAGRGNASAASSNKRYCRSQPVFGECLPHLILPFHEHKDRVHWHIHVMRTVDLTHPDGQVMRRISVFPYAFR